MNIGRGLAFAGVSLIVLLIILPRQNRSKLGLIGGTMLPFLVGLITTPTIADFIAQITVALFEAGGGYLIGIILQKNINTKI